MQALQVLLVDDDDVDREKLRRQLAHTDLCLHITEADSLHGAMLALRRTQYDCILLDYFLGDGVGRDLLPLTRQRERQRPCPVIMVTGYCHERAAVEAVRDGVYDYFIKGHLSDTALAAAIENSQTWARAQHERLLAQHRLERLSLYDELTGLPNRHLFSDRLAQALADSARSGRALAVLVMDLNGFKQINDSLGHAVGDRVLSEIGQRLAYTARQTDSFARFGGDEFAGLLCGINTVEGAVVVAEKILATLREPLLIDGQALRVGASIGIALHAGRGADAQQLLQRADHAMYDAKRGARNYAVHDGSGEAAPGKRQHVASLLSDGIAQRELTLLYQPIVDLHSGRLCGVEALARWHSAALGLVLPNDFIPAAERSSAILPLSEALFDIALDQLYLWQNQGIHLPMSVNVSAGTLEDERLVSYLLDGLRTRDLPAQALRLEITETGLTRNPERGQRILAQLAAAGIEVSVDNFGTGYTSLKQLRDFELAEIKLDRQFTRQLRNSPRDASIVRSLAALATGFGIRLVAQGIEASQDLQLLRTLGCDLAQGYGIARPMPAEQLMDWQRRWRHQRGDPSVCTGEHAGDPAGECACGGLLVNGRSSRGHSASAAEPAYEHAGTAHADFDVAHIAGAPSERRA